MPSVARNWTWLVKVIDLQPGECFWKLGLPHFKNNISCYKVWWMMYRVKIFCSFSERRWRIRTRKNDIANWEMVAELETYFWQQTCQFTTACRQWVFWTGQRNWLSFSIFVATIYVIIEFQLSVRSLTDLNIL